MPGSPPIATPGKTCGWAEASGFSRLRLEKGYRAAPIRTMLQGGLLNPIALCTMRGCSNDLSDGCCRHHRSFPCTDLAILTLARAISMPCCRKAAQMAAFSQHAAENHNRVGGRREK